jgi:hypothetical protein
MAGSLATYNYDIMQTVCRRCGVDKGQRCFGQRGGGSPQPSHVVRREDAGYVWDPVSKELRKKV